ncbi:hypothetical protein DMB92_05275 [Campylobacter sp. MIT 99-7217]|uniref:hypothetical protein n=1 Tax=Campylobacter sp. MIT 99-7217 TaxID=535091 RepID=UPI001158964D|nr:hypothetical protein [Campylobacter sp. MIT 99-7217]TQR31800.1 hypothetical protein DMB92_05275 [Campylobacter sp. MIT 99-7217]
MNYEKNQEELELENQKKRESLNLEQEQEKLENLNAGESLTQENTQNQNKERPPLESFIKDDGLMRAKQNSQSLQDQNTQNQASNLENQNSHALQNESLKQENLNDTNTEQSLENLQNPQNKESSFVKTGIKGLNERLENEDLSLYEAYLLKKFAGIDTRELYKENDPKANLDLKVKKLSGDSDFKALHDINSAMESLSSIIANADKTSGWWNSWARWLSDKTGHTLFAADDDNQQRMADEGNVYLKL